MDASFAPSSKTPPISLAIRIRFEADKLPDELLSDRDAIMVQNVFEMQSLNNFAEDKRDFRLPKV
jgi:hypothetical protein